MRHLNLSPADTLFLPDDYPIEFVFLYQARIPTERIREAFASVSEAFWPVFCEYRDGALWPRAQRAESVLDESEVPNVLDLTATERLPSSTVAALRPSQHPVALLSCHVTQFDNGTAIAIRLSHVVSDGYSYFHFVSSLARAARNLSAESDAAAPLSMPAPTHDRNALRTANLVHGCDGPTPVRRGVRIHVETLSRALVHGAVKDAAKTTGVRVSINDVICAMTVKRLSDLSPKAFARELAVTIPVDVRTQVAAYGPSHFGNAVWYHRVQLERDQVARMDLGAIAAAIRRSMPSVTTDSYTQHLDALTAHGQRESASKVYDPTAGCLVSNLSHVPLSLLDFGAGAPVCMIPILWELHSAAVTAVGSDYQVRLSY